MTTKMVLAEVDSEGQAVRIFRTVKASLQLPVESVAEFTKALAVGQIRRQVFARAECTPHQAGSCEWCGRYIEWESGKWTSGEMHEVVPKGKGGEVSVENSVAICRNCHTVSPDSAHGNRRWHSSKLRSRVENVHELWSKTVQSAVRQYARSQTPEDREDLESECFIEILEKGHLWKPILEEQGQNSARNYIHKLCRNRVLDVGRANALEVEIVDVDVSTVQKMDKGLGPDTDAIEEAIGRLNRDEQYIVRRTFYQGETEREVAASLGCGRTHVRSIRAKALAQIKTYLETK